MFFLKLNKSWNNNKQCVCTCTGVFLSNWGNRFNYGNEISASKPEPNAARKYPFTSRPPSRGVSFATNKKLGSAIDVSTKPTHLRNVRYDDVAIHFVASLLSIIVAGYFIVLKKRPNKERKKIYRTLIKNCDDT